MDNIHSRVKIRTGSDFLESPFDLNKNKDNNQLIIFDSYFMREFIQTQNLL